MKTKPYHFSKSLLWYIVVVDASWVLLKCFRVLSLSWGLTLAPLLLLIAVKLLVFFIFLVQYLITRSKDGKS